MAQPVRVVHEVEHPEGQASGEAVKQPNTKKDIKFEIPAAEPARQEPPTPRAVADPLEIALSSTQGALGTIADQAVLELGRTQTEIGQMIDAIGVARSDAVKAVEKLAAFSRDAVKANVKIQSSLVELRNIHTSD